jgi:O-succinylbenzoic acid--CoA ligase
MAFALTAPWVKQRIQEQWLGSVNPDHFLRLYEGQLIKFASPAIATILIYEPEPMAFLASFLAAVTLEKHIFIANPQWQQSEWEQIRHRINPDLVVGIEPPIAFKGAKSWALDQIEPMEPLIMIPTGGSGGQIKFAMHPWVNLVNSAEGFRSEFNLATIHSYCVLPLCHVSGLMQVVRTLISGGQLIVQPYQQLKAQVQTYDRSREKTLLKAFPANFLLSPASTQLLPDRPWFLSLVPTQLAWLLKFAGSRDWLQQFAGILLGGAPPWEQLLRDARARGLAIALTYGMTETASQIATLHPEEFLKGNNSVGKVLPHAAVSFDSRQQIQIKATSLFWGYYPELRQGEEWNTQDLGYIDDNFDLYIQGRSDRVIISGGENVFPQEVEQAIKNTGLVQDVHVFGMPDPHWGALVTAKYVPHPGGLIPSSLELKLQEKLRRELSPYKVPRSWMMVEEIQRNDQGKIIPTPFP